MNNTKLAAAVVVGYVLGRLHKARWALALAGMAAGKKISTSPRALLGGVMDSSPQLRKLAETVGGDLVQAGAKAGVAAASHRMEGLTERLEQRTESLRDADTHQGEESEEEQEDDAPARESSRSRGSGSEQGSAASKRSPSSRERSASSTSKSSTSKKTPSRSSSSRPAEKTTPRKSTAKKTTSSSTARKTDGRSSSKSTSGTRASTRKE